MFTLRFEAPDREGLSPRVPQGVTLLAI